MARAARIFALTTVLVLALGIVGAGAEGETSSVSSMTATATATGINVTGKAAFVGGPTVEVGTDATGDGRVPGSDLVGASITQLSQSQLRFDLKVANLPPGVGGTPEALNYAWPLEVTKGSASSAVTLQAWRTSTAADALCGVVFACPGQAPEGKPRFTVNTCAPDPTTGNNTCSSVGVNGEFTATGLSWIVPVAAINAGGGAVLHPAAAVASSVGGSGLYWYDNGTGGDTMTVESFTAHPATVTLGVAPEGTAEGDVPLTKAATVSGSNGNFSGVLPAQAAGNHIVVAKACLGPNSCGSASRVVTAP